MSQISMIVLIAVVGAIAIGILLYLAFESKILMWAEIRKQNRAFKRNKKILDMLYNDIMFKKTVLEEDAELDKIVELYPYLAEEITDYRRFRNECFTGDIIKMRDEYNEQHREDL